MKPQLIDSIIDSSINDFLFFTPFYLDLIRQHTPSTIQFA